MPGKTRIADWERLPAHAEILQTRLPGAVLVGGTAAALHAGHRISFDHDHVIAALGRDYERALAVLETMTLRLKGGGTLKIPTVAEMLRIKAFLLVERNATRDLSVAHGQRDRPPAWSTSTFRRRKSGLPRPAATRCWSA